MDSAIFCCILLYFRSLRIPRTFEGRVEQDANLSLDLGFLRVPKTSVIETLKINAHGFSFIDVQSFKTHPKIKVSKATLD
jgi:hypothetical protein